MGTFGIDKLLIILVIVLVLFGAKRVPEIGASIGKGIREFKKNIGGGEREVPETRPPDRVASGETAVRSKDEQPRPEPKRLM